MELTSRQQQAIETKKRIFEKAMEIFTQKSFDKVTINDICKAAGVSTGAFYHYFESKEQLLLEQYIKIDQTYGAAVNDLKGADAVTRIYEYMNHYAISAEEDGLEVVTEVYRAFLTLKVPFPVVEEEGFLYGLQFLVSEGQKEMLIDPKVEALHVAEQLLMIARGVIFSWCQERAGFSLREKIVECIKLFLNAYTINEAKIKNK